MYKSLVLIVRTWFRRSVGSQYFTVSIIVDGIIVHRTVRQRGYGSYYEQVAHEWLAANDFLPLIRNENSSHAPLWSVCEERGINYYREEIPVARQRDL